jgi:hypothetical protein
MDGHDVIFQFEADFAGALYCIPMSVRLKLDQVGVKVSLKQWNRFERAERDELLLRPCESADEQGAYRNYLLSVLRARTGDAAQQLPIEAQPPWQDAQRVPPQVSRYFEAQSLPPLSVGQWASLSPLKRFVLLKLTRPGHSNENFMPALREFGLLRAAQPSMGG